MARATQQIEPSSYACTPPAAPPDANFCIDLKSIQKSFQVWRQGMMRGAPERPSASVLTPQDTVVVGVVTIRESYQHRRWPREIVERFLAAELMTGPPASHSACGELNKAARRSRLWRLTGEGYATVTSLLRR